ncbi:MAG: hypothetical protein R3C68_16935 [Myxococcota bacterium]
MKSAFPGATVGLLEGGRGDFIVKHNNRELWNKKQMQNTFPDQQVIVERLSP